MRSVNKVILIGNLTRDPEMRQTPNGQVVTTFGLATNREWNTRDHQKHSLAEFHDLVAWAKLAEICAKHLKKGKLIYVEGYLKTRSWDTPEGVKKFKTEIVVQDMIILEKRSTSEENEYIPEEENGGSLNGNTNSNGMQESAPEEASSSSPKNFGSPSKSRPSDRIASAPPRKAPPSENFLDKNKSESSTHQAPKINLDINDDLGL